MVPEGIDLAVSEAARQDVAAPTAVAALHRARRARGRLVARAPRAPTRHQRRAAAPREGHGHRGRGVGDRPRAARPVNLVIVGGDLDRPSPDEHGQLQRIAAVRASSLGAATGLVLARHRPNDVVARWLAAAHAGLGRLIAPGGAYVCGSRKEEFGLAILEAMAAGLPVVGAGRGRAGHLRRGRRHRRPRRHPRSAKCGRRRPWALALDLAHAPDGERDARLVGDQLHVQAMARGAHRVYAAVPAPAARMSGALMTLLVITPDYASHVLPLATLATAWRDRERVWWSPPDRPPPYGGLVWLRAGRPAPGTGIQPWCHPRRAAAGAKTRPTCVLRGHSPRHGRRRCAIRPMPVVTTCLWEPAPPPGPCCGSSTGCDRTTSSSTTLPSRHLAMRAGGVPYGDVVLGHPSALPVGDEVYGFPTAWPRAFHPDPAALAALHRRCVEVRDAFTADVERALTVLNQPVTGTRCVRGPRRRAVLQLPGRAAPPARTTLLPPHVFLGTAVRDERRPTMWPRGSTPTIPDCGVRLLRHLPLGPRRRARQGRGRPPPPRRACGVGHRQRRPGGARRAAWPTGSSASFLPQVRLLAAPPWSSPTGQQQRHRGAHLRRPDARAAVLHRPVRRSGRHRARRPGRGPRPQRRDGRRPPRRGPAGPCRTKGGGCGRRGVPPRRTRSFPGPSGHGGSALTGAHTPPDAWRRGSGSAASRRPPRHRLAPRFPG